MLIPLIAIGVLTLALGMYLKVITRRAERDRAEIERLRTDRKAAADATARLNAMACRVRVYDTGSLGPYPEQRPGPGVLAVTRYHARRLVTETEEHLRAAARRPGA